jgi:uncharacterized MAPEG superfamily protein
MTADLFWLTLTALMTVLLPVPYVMERILRVGLMPAMGYSKESGTGGFDQSAEKPAAWAKRAFAAHRNAIEGFAVFAALVLAAHVTNVNPAEVAMWAKIYFFARLAHYVVYTAGVPVVRTLTFAVALAALFMIGSAILSAA